MPDQSTAPPCAQCGHPYRRTDRRQRFCGRPCFRLWWLANVSRRASEKGNETLQALRAAGADPAHGGEAAKKRAAKIAESNRANPRRKRRDSTLPATNARPATVEPPAIGPTAATLAGKVGADSTAWVERGDYWQQQAGEQRSAIEAKARRDTLTVAGHGAGLFVERSALIVHDGLTHHSQTRTRHVLQRGTHHVERIILLNPTGSLSLDALRWCQEQAVAVLILRRDGTIVSAVHTEPEGDAGLRRIQYTLIESARAHLARWLVAHKLAEQHETLRLYFPTASDALDAVAGAYTTASASTVNPWLSTLDELRLFEGRAAVAYFSAWSGYPLRWPASDRKRVPSHWTRMRERSSPLSQNARRAVDPANAILNYAYGVLEGQCHQALIALGFDTACGILHADKQRRASLVYDLMELYRPRVDRLALAFLGTVTFRYGDMLLGTDGQCRLHPQLARAVVSACRLPDQAIRDGAKELRLLMERTVSEPRAQPGERRHQTIRTEV